MCITPAARLDAGVTYAGAPDLSYARAMAAAAKKLPRGLSQKIALPTLFAFGSGRAARRAYSEALEAHREVMERRLEPVVERVLNDLGDIAARAVADGGVDHAAAEIAGSTSMVEALYEVIYAEAIPYFAERVYASTKSDPMVFGRKDDADVWADRARRWVQLNAGIMIRGVTDTTVDLVRAIAEEGALQGWGMEKIGRELRREWPAISQYRAVVIARTETITASSEGAQVAAEQLRDDSGLDIRKEWIATFDHRTRDSHADADGQVVALDGYFLVEDDMGMMEQAQYPGDPMLSAGNRIQCRCSHAFAAD